GEGVGGRGSATAASGPVGEDAAPDVHRAPDAGAQTLQLHDLAVVHEQVDLRPVGLDVPGEHGRVGGLEHQFLKAQGVHQPGDDVGSPGPHVLGDALRLDHDAGGAGLQVAAGELDGRPGVAGAL